MAFQFLKKVLAQEHGQVNSPTVSLHGVPLSSQHGETASGLESEPIYIIEQRRYSKGSEFRGRLSDAVEKYIDLAASASTKQSYRAVAERFEVDKDTLRRHVKAKREGKRLRSPGGCHVLTVVEELSLMLWILLLARLRFPATKRQILIEAQEIAVAKERSFKGGLPSNKWWRNFKRTYPQLKLRKVKALSEARSAAATRQVLDQFYADLRWLVEHYSLDSERIYNMDETGLESLGGKSRVAVQAGSDAAATLQENGKHITLIACVNAAGTSAMPPTFLFTGQEGSEARQDLLPGCPDGWTCMHTPKGWITMKAFAFWLELFIGATKPTAQRPVLLIVDNHSSRFNADMLQHAMDHHVLLLALPSNTTDLLQPLDVGVFGPFKHAAHLAIDRLSLNGERPLLKQNIAKSLRDVWFMHVNKHNIQTGFRLSGVWPVNSFAVPDSKLANPLSSIANPAALALDVAPAVPPAQPIHSFVHSLLGPDAAPLSLPAIPDPGVQAPVAAHGQEIKAAKPQSGSEADSSDLQERRLRSAVSSYSGPLSMQSVLSGKPVELTLMPEHVQGILRLPYQFTDAAKKQKSQRKKKEQPFGGLMTSASMIARLKAKDAAKLANEEAKAKRKAEREEKKKKKLEEKEEKKAVAKAKKKQSEEKRAAKKSKPKAMSKAKAKPKKRKRVESDEESEAESGSDDSESNSGDSEDSDQSEAESSASSDDEDDTSRVRKGFAIVTLIPEPSDPRPFGLAYVPRDYDNELASNKVISIHLYMPVDLNDLLASTYKPVLVSAKGKKRKPKTLDVLAGQFDWHSFKLVNGKLPEVVQVDMADRFAVELATYASLRAR